MKKLSCILEKTGINTIEDLFQLVNKKVDEEKAILRIDITEKILDSVFKGKGVIKIKDTEIYYLDTRTALNLLLAQQKEYAKEKYGIKSIKIKEAIKFTYANNPKLDIIIKPNESISQKFRTSLTEILYKNDESLIEYIKTNTNCKIIKQIDCRF